MSMSPFVANLFTAFGGGAIVRFIDWRRTRDERQALLNAQRENLAIGLLRDEVRRCLTRIEHLEHDVRALREEKHDAVGKLNAALLEVIALKSEVNEVCARHDEPARYDLRLHTPDSDASHEPPEGHTYEHP